MDTKVNKPTKVITTISIILIIMLVILFVYLIHSYILLLQQAKPEISAAIITASSTTLIALISFIASKYYERKAIVEQQIREKKIPEYDKFIKFLLGFLFADKMGKKIPKDTEIVESFVNFTGMLILWGSDDVFKEFVEYKKHYFMIATLDKKSQEYKSANIEGLFKFEKLLYAIRKDIGHKNKNLLKGDILSTLVNDVQDYL